MDSIELPSTKSPAKVIAIDYDGTWTALPGFFRAISGYPGAKFIIVTGRDEMPPRNELEAMGLLGYSIFCTAGKPKKQFMDALGIHVDIWIDDEPRFIDARGILNDDMPVHENLGANLCEGPGFRAIKIKHVEQWSGVIRAEAGIEHDITTDSKFVAETRPRPGQWLIVTKDGGRIVMDNLPR